MAKFVSIAAKAFKTLLSKARSNRADDLAYTIEKMAKPGKEGRVIVPKNKFNSLMRAAGPLTKSQHELMGKAGSRSQNEVRALRGGKARTTEQLAAIGRVKAGLPAYPGRGPRNEPRNLRRADYEEEMQWNRAEERSAARTGQKIDRVRER